MRWQERRRKLRAILAGDACINPGSVWDPMSARIAEDLGFELGMFAGSTASLTILGAPDAILITLSEFAEQAHRVCRACTMPLMVDADHGYGNALNVMRTVEEMERAGVSGMSIEDTVLPMAHGSPRKASFISIEEGVGKMRAAVEARRDPLLVIAGRTSCIGTTGLDDAVARVTAYEEAGVDALFLVGVKTKEQIEAIAAKVSLPIILGNPGPEIADNAYLAPLGVRIALTGHQPIMAAVQAAYATLKALREGTPPKELKGLPSPELMKQVTRGGDYDRWIDTFLGGK